MAAIGCAQCGRPLPGEAAELAGWRNAALAAAGEDDENIAAMLVCPECAEEDQLGDYEQGGAG